MSEHDDDYRYSVAWTDLLATGSALGRGILWRGDHTLRDGLPDSIGDPLAYETRSLGSVPNVIPAPGLVNKLTSSLFNELWFRKAPKSRDGEVKTIPGYFHPLDSVGHWNRLYGPHGFVQYQFLVPFGQEESLCRVVSDIARAGCATPLVVLKRFGEGNRGFLSFPARGWTLTVDIAARFDGLGTLLRNLDEIVLAAGGRHYLAKDSHMGPETLVRGYPRLEEWKSVKNRVDPNGVWSSDLARRLEL
jgi:decaprenylphospho-beta-D-ribofuranose 2-oxidase